MSWASEKTGFHSCNCIGPQNGDPACPCMMRSVRVKDDRYVREIDLGPVKVKSSFKIEHCKGCNSIVPSHANFCPNCGARQ